MLIYLLIDAARNLNDIQSRIAENPKAVAKEYKLSKAEIALLRRGDKLEILGQLAVQAAQVVGSAGDRNVVAMMPWPSSEVTVASISPDKGPTGAAITVTVTGSNFQTGATLSFVNPTRTVQAAVTGVTSGTSSTLTATVTFPTGSAGKYDVIVQNSDSGSGTLAQGFTVRRS
jgi:hypothetical protein